MGFCDLRVFVRKLACPFGHQTQVSTPVQLAAICDNLRVRLASALVGEAAEEFFLNICQIWMLILLSFAHLMGLFTRANSLREHLKLILNTQPCITSSIIYTRISRTKIQYS